MPSNPTRAGYSFGGWYTGQNGGGSQFTASTVVSSGTTTVYAKWTGSYSTVTSITYSSVSGGTWTVESDGRHKSPTISNSTTTKSRISFTSIAANQVIVIQLDVSSEPSYDYAFISTLNNGSATYQSGYYSGSLISGTNSVTVSIPVPTVGNHFVDIGYRKDGSNSSGSDCAWFKVIQ
jgi:uncharacterized repeat protein (TIGR02543 family)